MLLSSMSSILMSSRGKMRCLQNRFWSPRSIATIGPPDAVDILPNDASPDENVVEEKEVFFPPSRPGPLHQQSLRQKTSALVGYLYPRGAEDILWIFSVRGKEPEIKLLLCQPVSWWVGVRSTQDWVGQPPWGGTAYRTLFQPVRRNLQIFSAPEQF